MQRGPSVLDDPFEEFTDRVPPDDGKKEFAMNAAYSVRGTPYGGYLVLIYDERGEIMEYKTSSERLYQNLDTLKGIPIGKWMD